MTTWFVSRHPGAVAWAMQQGFRVDQHTAHLDPSQVQSGDTVIGTLPVNLAAQVCRQGAEFFNLSLDLPIHLRGKELSVDELRTCHARLERFHVAHIPVLSSTSY